MADENHKLFQSHLVLASFKELLHCRDVETQNYAPIIASMEKILEIAQADTDKAVLFTAQANDMDTEAEDVILKEKAVEVRKMARDLKSDVGEMYKQAAAMKAHIDHNRVSIIGLLNKMIEDRVAEISKYDNVLIMDNPSDMKAFELLKGTYGYKGDFKSFSSPEVGQLQRRLDREQGCEPIKRPRN